VAVELKTMQAIKKHNKLLLKKKRNIKSLKLTNPKLKKVTNRLYWLFIQKMEFLAALCIQDQLTILSDNGI